MLKATVMTIVGALVFNAAVQAQIYVKSTGVGVGTSTPAEQLHVAGKIRIDAADNVLSFNSPANAWQYFNFNKGGERYGYFGLTPGRDFVLKGEKPGHFYIEPLNGRVIITSTQDNGKIGGSLTLVHPGKTGGTVLDGTIQARDWAIYNMKDDYGNSLQFWAYADGGCAEMCRPAVIFSDMGKVGIGMFPQHKLDVDGDINAKSYYLNDTHWADYVFDSTYHLPSLVEVEKYIKQNHHLPEIPSAEEVKKDGVSLSDNHIALLKKIEELTLYVIEQNKKITELESKMKALEQKKQ
jgi:hypothetical protein